MHDVLIVGAGPAGLTAGIYARRAAKTVLILEKGAPGGQIINTPDIENFPTQAHISGFDFAEKLFMQVKDLGADVSFERVVSLEKKGGAFMVTTNKNTHVAKSVIIATGADCRKLGVPEEERLVGRGVSYCATCDGALYKGKKVAVVGGGNTALEDALYLSDFAESVTLIHRRDAFRGDDVSLQRLKEKKNVSFCLNARVTGLISEKRLTGIEVTTSDGKVTTISLDGLFVAIGRVPESAWLSSLVTCDESGYLVCGEDCKTNLLGLFVAGDVRSKQVRQLVTATADGALAATAAVSYLQTL